MRSRRLFALVVGMCLLSSSLIGCSGPAGGSSPGDGLTSIEAAELAWKTGGSVFEQAVLWRMIPSSDKKATTTQLLNDWQQSDRSAGWVVWLADRASGDWFIVAIRGTKVVDSDLGTRAWTATPMGSDWPDERPAVSMKEAAEEAKAQGVDLSTLTWTEFACDYPASDFRNRPLWVIACSETLDSGAALNYRIFIDGITGTAIGAINERDEKMTLPIDRDALQQKRADTHEADLREFFASIGQGRPEDAVRQLAHEASPNNVMAELWLANFRSLASLSIVGIEQASLEQWTSEREYYKVTLDVRTSDPPEKYGWENGRNIRWVSIIPEGAGYWKIAALSPNP